MFHSSITSDLKAFSDKFGFDVLILLANYLSEEQQPRRQIAVYSENLELCSQVRTSLTQHISLHPLLLALRTCGGRWPWTGDLKKLVQEIRSQSLSFKKCWGYFAHSVSQLIIYLFISALIQIFSFDAILINQFSVLSFRFLVFSFDAVLPKNHLNRIVSEIKVGLFFLIEV